MGKPPLDDTSTAIPPKPAGTGGAPRVVPALTVVAHLGRRGQVESQIEAHAHDGYRIGTRVAAPVKPSPLDLCLGKLFYPTR